MMTMTMRCEKNRGCDVLPAQLMASHFYVRMSKLEEVVVAIEWALDRLSLTLGEALVYELDLTKGLFLLKLVRGSAQARYVLRLFWDERANDHIVELLRGRGGEGQEWRTPSARTLCVFLRGVLGLAGDSDEELGVLMKERVEFGNNDELFLRRLEMRISQSFKIEKEGREPNKLALVQSACELAPGICSEVVQQLLCSVILGKEESREQRQFATIALASMCMSNAGCHSVLVRFPQVVPALVEYLTGTKKARLEFVHTQRATVQALSCLAASSSVGFDAVRSAAAVVGLVDPEDWMEAFDWVRDRVLKELLAQLREFLARCVCLSHF